MGYRGRSQSSYGNVRRLQRIHAQRSNRARKVDESLRAPLAKSPEQWLAQPNRYDVPEVDTPKEKPLPSSTISNSGTHRQFTKYLQRQSMRRVCGTRY